MFGLSCLLRSLLDLSSSADEVITTFQDTDGPVAHRIHRGLFSYGVCVLCRFLGDFGLWLLQVLFEA